MPRYIDADNIPYEYDNNFRVVAPKHQIDNMPTEDVQPVKHGRWEPTWTKNEACCSECNGFVKFDSPFEDKYCRYCGAKMDRSEENDD